VAHPSLIVNIHTQAKTDVEAFYGDMSAKGVLFSMPPKKQDFGGVLAQFVDSEGAHCSVGAEAA